MYEKERTIKEYFCAKCGKKITTSSVICLGVTRKSRHSNGGLDYFCASFGATNVKCLCNKCEKELGLFLENKYPHDKSEREKELERKIEEITSDINERFGLLIKYMTSILAYGNDIFDKINSSPYLKCKLENEISESLDKEIKRITGE